MFAHVAPIVAVMLLAFPVFAAEKIVPLEIGATAPPFELPGVDGQTYTLDSFADKDVLALVFTCNHCPTAQAYEDDLIQMATDYADKSAAIVAISPNDPEALRLDELGYTDVSDGFEDMKYRAADRGFNFPYLYDGDTQTMSRAYGPQATPHCFVFGKDRKLRYVGRVNNNEREGKTTDHDLRNAIDALLAGETVPVEKTPAFGCSTKWSDKRGSVAAALEKWAKEDVTLEVATLDEIRGVMKNDTENYRLVNLWASWCIPCRVEFPELITIKRMYSTRPFEFVSISADAPEARESVRSFLKEMQASNRNLISDNDDSYALIDAVGAGWEGVLPYTVLLAPGGEMVYSHAGQIDPLELKRAIVDKLGRTYK